MFRVIVVLELDGCGLVEVVLTRFAVEGVCPDVVSGLFVDAGPVGVDSLSFLFDTVRFGPGSAVTPIGRGSGFCGGPDAGVDRGRDSVETEVAAVAARLVEVTLSDVMRNGVLKSDSMGCCGCISDAASSPCGSYSVVKSLKSMLLCQSHIKGPPAGYAKEAERSNGVRPCSAICPGAFDDVGPGSRYPSSTTDGFMEDGVDACEAVILWSLRALCRRVETLLELGLGFVGCWSLDWRVFLREAGSGRLIDCPKRNGKEWCKTAQEKVLFWCEITRMAQTAKIFEGCRSTCRRKMESAQRWSNAGLRYDPYCKCVEIVA